MDEFTDDRSELTGTLISLEFGPGGRITHFWAADPTIPEDSEEFQFVLGPVSFGEEFSEDYYPGTILLGARTTPDEPWIVSRNTGAETLEDDDLLSIRFEYDFPLLPEIRSTGRFYELPGTVPQVCWDVEIENRGRVAIEIGELAFPFAFYNFMQGASRDEKGGRNPFQDRVTVHKFIGGSASYLHAQRMSNEAPGLLVFPGDGTSWEMYTHVPRTLSSHYHWEGIPVVYVYSRASIEREGWNPSHSDHTSLILEPGDSKRVQTRFVPSSPSMGDAVFHTLSACGRPAMRALPAAVAPVQVGIAVEVGGVRPTRFSASKTVEIESDADDSGGFCFVRPSLPGPVRLRIDDRNGGRSDANLLFLEPIETLIEKRAAWIASHQFHDEPGTALEAAILPANTRTQERIASSDDFAFPFTLESGLADALFLAEKNALAPDGDQIRILERFLREFLRDDVQNPADGSVGCIFADLNSVAIDYGRPRVYPLVFNFYMAMYRIARRYGLTQEPALAYLHEATRTAYAFFRMTTRAVSGGLPGYSRIVDIVEALEAEGLHDNARDLQEYALQRAREVIRQPVGGIEDLSGDAGRFEDLYWAARFLGDETTSELALQHAFALRDLGPNWQSYGSDYRIFHEFEGVPHDAIVDKGQLMLGHTTVANSLMVLEELSNDHHRVDDVAIRMAFGGMLGVWALIRPDGAASMGFCPDAASAQYGFNPITGDIGLALFQYLRRSKSVVIPSRLQGVTTFGCHFEATESEYVVQPWDGVAQRIAMRQIGLDLELETGRILELRVDRRKRKLSLQVENLAPLRVQSEIRVRGLWGHAVTYDGETYDIADGYIRVPFALGERQVATVRVEVKG